MKLSKQPENLFLKYSLLSLRFVQPSLLHRFQDFFATALGVVVKIGQRQNQIAQLGKAHGGGVDAVAVGVVKFFGDALDVGPFHGVRPCKRVLRRQIISIERQPEKAQNSGFPFL